MSSIEFTLYVAGSGARAKNSLEQVQRMCQEQLGGRARLCVVDLLSEPELARQSGVFLAPTLVKESPGPSQRVFGDLRDGTEVLWALGVEADAAGQAV